ncbi:MAG TPA: hypothetical protein VFS60_03035 [Thermoanaerobaculia bacterium]|nr:hypothetical protein [Thermoanaerobaculia bacterium]
MWRGALRALAFGVGGLALACASTTAGNGSRSLTTTTTTAATIVKAKVDAAGKVDRDEIHLSKSRGHQVHWDVEGADSLAIVPKDPATWPLEVKCTGGHCEGVQKPDAALGPHEYSAEVGGKAGADPVLIIDG